MKNSVSTPSLKSHKPIMITCYICGQQLGSKSFCIHLKSCEIKFNNEQQLKSNSSEIMKLPESPDLLNIILSGDYDTQTLIKYNNEASEVYKYKILSKCKYCTRTFNYQSLKVHQKGCDKKLLKNKYSTQQLIINYQSMQLKKPKTLVCCVCGRQCGTNSLKIHYPQCLYKFNNNQILRCLNLKDRRVAPQFSKQQIQMINSKEEWSCQQVQEFNKISMIKFRNQSLVQCYNCKRRFQAQSLQKHQKNCVLINGNKNPQGHLKRCQSQKVMHFFQKQFKKPRFLMCYICGRQFGLTSLSIHQKTCHQMFRQEQINKPKLQRKKLPQLPQQIQKGDFNILQAQSWQLQKIELYNKLISEVYNKKTLTACYICERTFFEQSLPKHIIHCENQLQRLKLKRGRSQDQTEIVKRCESVQKARQIQRSVQKLIPKPKVLMCYICGREFGLTSLQIHLKSCPEKFLNQQSLKQKQKQKPLPELSQQLQKLEFNLNSAIQWPIEKIQYYNKIVFDIYNKKSLQTCYLCERSFFQESFQKHFKHCQQYTLEKIKRSTSLTQKQQRILNKHKLIQRQKYQKQNQYFMTLQNTKPKTLTCHICGRDYGLTSLQIHLPKCSQKFIIYENKKSLQQRKMLPNLQDHLNLEQFNIQTAYTWSRQKIDAYNQITNKIYKNKSLTKCEYCNRTFQEEQYKKHLNHCQKENQKKTVKFKQTDKKEQSSLLRKCKSAKQLNLLSLGSSKPIQQTRQPKFLVCHICGRQFGPTSLKIHLPQCAQKFIKQQKLKPQKKRKALPELCLSQKQKQTYDISKVQSWSGQMIKQYNLMCTQVYRKQSLQVCKYCGRSFFQQQLPKHIKFCQKQAIKRQLKNNKSERQVISTTQQTLKEVTERNNETYQVKQEKISSNQHKKEFQLITLVMSIIKQQDLQTSISPNLKNSQNSNIGKNNSSNLKEIKQFSIMPIQVSDLCESPQSFDYIQKVNISSNIENKSQVLDKHMNKPKYLTKKIQTQSRSSMTRRHTISSNSLRPFMELKKKQSEPLNLNEYQKEDKKQCHHCKKKVKNDLYQRHIKMCKSNSSMTGYLKQQSSKLKI